MLKDLWLDWTAWWATVTPEFAFLLALPLMVVVAAIIGECFRRHKK